MKKNLFIFIILLVALLAFQAKVIMPIIYDVIASDFFLEDSDDEKNRLSSNNLLTDAAHKQCNLAAEEELSIEGSVNFSERPLNAFSLGNYKYVINADIEILPNDGPTFIKRYVCRIKYLEGNDNSGFSNSENWSIEGLGLKEQ